MLTAFALSALFLISYVIYHSLPKKLILAARESSATSTFLFSSLISFWLRPVVPLVLITLVRGLSNKFDKHRKIARWTFPLWLYVAVTGVVVYLMLRPYY